MMKSRFWLLLTAGVLLGLALAWGLITLLRPYSFHGTVLQSPDKAPNFTLQSAGGPISLRDFEGKIILLYFGYTFCPDICPATLVEVAKAVHILGRQAEQVQVIMLSVDPLRDTPEKLQEYMAHFNPNFLGVTGTEAELASIAALYGIYYQKHEGSPATGYLVDHTATLMAIDQQGHLKVLFSFGTPGEEIAADLAHMLK